MPLRPTLFFLFQECLSDENYKYPCELRSHSYLHLLSFDRDVLMKAFKSAKVLKSVTAKLNSLARRETSALWDSIKMSSLGQVLPSEAVRAEFFELLDMQKFKAGQVLQEWHSVPAFCFLVQRGQLHCETLVAGMGDANKFTFNNTAGREALTSVDFDASCAAGADEIRGAIQAGEGKEEFEHADSTTLGKSPMQRSNSIEDIFLSKGNFAADFNALLKKEKTALRIKAHHDTTCYTCSAAKLIQFLDKFPVRVLLWRGFQVVRCNLL